MKIIEILKKTQDELLTYTSKELMKCGYKKITSKDSFIYAEGNIPVLLVAHLDIVHRSTPKTILYDKQLQMLWSPTGIGGDDRCGVYAILEIVRQYKPFVLFTTDEEIGGVGADKFVNAIEALPVNFIIEIDRRGCGQAVFYDCGNVKFQKYITSYGFNKCYGTFSDISIISPMYDIASVNLSAGYYNEHTSTEYIDLNDLHYTINGVKNILSEVDKDEFFDYQEIKYSRYYYETNEDVEIEEEFEEEINN